LKTRSQPRLGSTPRDRPAKKKKKVAGRKKSGNEDLGIADTGKTLLKPGDFREPAPKERSRKKGGKILQKKQGRPGCKDDLKI